MNKIYSLSKSLAVAAFALLTATACSDGYEYTPDKETQNKIGQVYFDQTLPSTIELNSGQTEFEVTLTRVNNEGDITVKLVTTQPEPAIYNVPEEVTFADGTTESTIQITVNPNDLEYDDMRELIISIEDNYSTPYGNQNYTVKVGMPAPWTPWCNNAADFEEAGGNAEWPLGEVGQGTYTFGAVLTGNDTEKKVEFRQNTLTGECQFRILDVATSFFPGFAQIVFDAAWFESKGVYGLRCRGIDTGYYLEDMPDDPLIYYDELTFAEMRQGVEIPWDKWEQMNPELQSWYNPTTGYFKLAVIYINSQNFGARGVESVQMEGFYIPDYSAKVEFGGIYTDAKGGVSAVGMVSLGADAKNVRAMVLPQEIDIDTAIDFLTSDEPNENLPWVAVTESGHISIPFNPEAMGSEMLQIVMAVMLDGEIMATAKTPFEYYGGGSNPWQSLGKGIFYDDFIAPLYTKSGEAMMYEVEILEDSEHPGMYRIISPYTEDACKIGGAPSYSPAGSYILVDATDPDGVLIPMQSLNMDWGYGEMSILSWGTYAMMAGELTKEEAKSAGLLGKNDGKKITFPVLTTDKGLNYQGLLIEGSDISYAGMNSMMRIVLPDGVSDEEINAARYAVNARKFSKSATSRMKMVDKKAIKKQISRKNISPVRINPMSL